MQIIKKIFASNYAKSNYAKDGPEKKNSKAMKSHPLYKE